LTENGQFQTNDDSLDAQGNVNLIYNPYSWSQVANMLYLEQPKGVGFSYCAQGVRCVNNDTSVGVEAADFFEAFFAGFPEYAKNDFYITGESYAGIYIPEIMAELDRRGTINLKGGKLGGGWGGDFNNMLNFSTQLLLVMVVGEMKSVLVALLLNLIVSMLSFCMVRLWFGVVVCVTQSSSHPFRHGHVLPTSVHSNQGCLW